MSTTVTTTGVLCAETEFDLHALARSCAVSPDFVVLLVDEGLLAPVRSEPEWRFGGEALSRVQRIRRLQRDFDASLPSVALMLDLFEDIDRLRAALHRAGLAA